MHWHLLCKHSTNKQFIRDRSSPKNCLKNFEPKQNCSHFLLVFLGTKVILTNCQINHEWHNVLEEIFQEIAKRPQSLIWNKVNRASDIKNNPDPKQTRILEKYFLRLDDFLPPKKHILPLPKELCKQFRFG